MTPIETAFIALVTFWHPIQPCPMPHVVYNSDIIATTCQRQALHGYQAKACYFPKTQTIVLRSEWDADSHYDERMAFHELDRHIEMVCMGHRFKEAEPESVLAAEEMAP